MASSSLPPFGRHMMAKYYATVAAVGVVRKVVQTHDLTVSEYDYGKRVYYKRKLFVVERVGVVLAGGGYFAATFPLFAYGALRDLEIAATGHKAEMDARERRSDKGVLEWTLS